MTHRAGRSDANTHFDFAGRDLGRAAAAPSCSPTAQLSPLGRTGFKSIKLPRSCRMQEPPDHGQHQRAKGTHHQSKHRAAHAIPTFTQPLTFSQVDNRHHGENDRQRSRQNEHGKQAEIAGCDRPAGSSHRKDQPHHAIISMCTGGLGTEQRRRHTGQRRWHTGGRHRLQAERIRQPRGALAPNWLWRLDEGHDWETVGGSVAAGKTGGLCPRTKASGSPGVQTSAAASLLALPLIARASGGLSLRSKRSLRRQD